MASSTASVGREEDTHLGTDSYEIIPPSSSSTEQPSNLAFYTSSPSSDPPSSSDIVYLISSSDAGSIRTTKRERGRATQYLESRGFGWLMEVEEEEEEKPLL